MKRKELICLIISMIIFISLIILVKIKDFLPLEKDLFNFLSSFSFLKMFMFIITTMGEWFIFAFIVIILLFALKKRLSIIILINLLLSSGLNHLIKLIIARPRPEWKLIDKTEYSFPSGHSMVSLAFYGFLIYLIINYYHGKFKKTLIIILSILIFLIGLSRIYFGVHYLTDVIGGFMLAIIYLIIFITIIKKKELIK